MARMWRFYDIAKVSLLGVFAALPFKRANFESRRMQSISDALRHGEWVTVDL